LYFKDIILHFTTTLMLGVIPVDFNIYDGIMKRLYSLDHSFINDDQFIHRVFNADFSQDRTFKRLNMVLSVAGCETEYVTDGIIKASNKDYLTVLDKLKEKSIGDISSLTTKLNPIFYKEEEEEEDGEEDEEDEEEDNIFEESNIDVIKRNIRRIIDDLGKNNKSYTVTPNDLISLMSLILHDDNVLQSLQTFVVKTMKNAGEHSNVVSVLEPDLTTVVAASDPEVVVMDSDTEEVVEVKPNSKRTQLDLSVGNFIGTIKNISETITRKKLDRINAIYLLATNPEHYSKLHDFIAYDHSDFNETVLKKIIEDLKSNTNVNMANLMDGLQTILNAVTKAKPLQ